MMMRAARRVGTVVALLACGAGAQFSYAVPIARSARPVQCDGFLMEWVQQDARPMGANEALLWDAVQTPDGVAGYVRITRRAACAVSAILVVREDEVDSIVLEVPGEHHACCPFHAARFDSASGEVVVEFLLTWQRLGSTAQAGQYRLRLEALDTAGSQCALVTIAGPADSLLPQIFTPALRGRIALVVALLALYLGLLRWVRKKRSDRRQSPHQSA